MSDIQAFFRVWSGPKATHFLAEHIWQHLDDFSAVQGIKNCKTFLIPAGRLRIAVPDGNHPDPVYIDKVRLSKTPGVMGRKGALSPRGLRCGRRNDHTIAYSKPWSMVEHIGWGGHATNATDVGIWASPMLENCPPLPASWPEPFENPECHKLWKTIYGGRPTIPKRYYHLARRMVSGLHQYIRNRIKSGP